MIKENKHYMEYLAKYIKITVRITNNSNASQTEKTKFCLKKKKY